MAKLPVVSGADAVKAFERAGWRVDRQRGVHGTALKFDSGASPRFTGRVQFFVMVNVETSASPVVGVKTTSRRPFETATGRLRVSTVR